MKNRATLTIPERKALRLTVLCLALLGGAGLFWGYANPFYHLPPLALLFPACLAVLGRLTPTAKGGFYAAWLCATIGNSACLYWVSVPMHDFGLIPWPLTVPPLLALGGYLGLYGALFAVLYRLFRERLPFFAALILAAPLWAALDIAKGWLFTGFPWVSLATAFVPWPEWTQGAALIGAHALSGIYAMAAVAVAEARPVRASFGQGSAITPRKRSFRCFLLVFLCMGTLYGYGMTTLKTPAPAGERIRIGLIQGNVDQNQKWAPEYQYGTLARYLTLSEWTVNTSMGKVATPVDFLIWPETALPFYLETNVQLAERIANFSREFRVPIAFGAPGKGRPEEGGYYNRMWLQTPTSPELRHYDKTHLVPFGEYVPLNLPIPFVEYFLQGLDFRPGRNSGSLRSGNLALGALICYEAIFPALAQERVAEGANLLVNISNDAWFGRTSAPLQHLHLTAMRAVEQGRYIVRSTNTGISGVISPKGIITVHGSLFRAEAVVGEAGLLTEVTPYHRASAPISWACVLATLAAAAYCLSAARKPA